MFGIDFSEILLIFGIALVVLGPEKLPKLANTIGKWIGRARGMARQFREQLEQESQTLHKDMDLGADFSSRPGAQPGNGSTTPRPTADSSTTPAQAGAQPRIDPRTVGPPAPMTGAPLPEMGLADTYPAAFHPYQPPPIAEPPPAAAPASSPAVPAATVSSAPATGTASSAESGSATAASAAAPAGTTGAAGAQDPSFPDPHQTAFWPPDGVL